MTLDHSLPFASSSRENCFHIPCCVNQVKFLQSHDEMVWCILTRHLLRSTMHIRVISKKQNDHGNLPSLRFCGPLSTHHCSAPSAWEGFPGGMYDRSCDIVQVPLCCMNQRLLRCRLALLLEKGLGCSSVDLPSPWEAVAKACVRPLEAILVPIPISFYSSSDGSRGSAYQILVHRYSKLANVAYLW